MDYEISAGLALKFSFILMVCESGFFSNEMKKKTETTCFEVGLLAGYLED